MTREEEILKEAKAFADGQCEALIKPDDEYAFEQGARWADRTMVEKACDWLEDFIKWNDLCTLEDIEQFRKAMKGDEL